MEKKQNQYLDFFKTISVVYILKCKSIKMMQRLRIGKMEKKTYKGEHGHVFQDGGRIKNRDRDCPSAALLFTTHSIRDPMTLICSVGESLGNTTNLTKRETRLTVTFLSSTPSLDSSSQSRL